jgi:hypothetical protein
MQALAKYVWPQSLNRPSGGFSQGADPTHPVVILALLVFAGACGVAIPSLGILVPAVVGTLALSMLVLALSPPAIVWLMLVLVLLVVGLLTFFANIQQALWSPYLLLLLVAIKYLLEKLHAGSLAKAQTGSLPAFNAISVLIGLFCLFFCLSALVNKTDLASVGVAAKNYIFPWFLTLLVASSIQQTDALRGIWKFMLWVVVIQVPFALVQHFYFAKLPGADWDAVSGTFGSVFLRGGGSGTMAIFLVFGIVLVTALFRKKQISSKVLTGVVLAALTTVALAEVKIFFLCLPLAMVLLFRSRILTNPLHAVGGGLLGAALLSLVVFAYQQTYSETLSQTRTVEGLVDYALAVESDPYAFDRTTREVSRIGALAMWARYNDADDHRFYIGHGPAASRDSQTIGSGVAARKYPFMLQTSTASTMLWDVGLFGYVFFLAILFVAGLSAFRIARQSPPFEAAVLDSIGVMLLINLPLTLYNSDLIDSTAAQVLLTFWLGYLLLCKKSFSASRQKNHIVPRSVS